MTADGLLLVDKPAGWTSHDVVARSRRLAHTRRVGHAGTLDPMATGVLVLGINKATKLLTFLVGCDKTYTATIRLGQSTVTDDAEGEVTASYDAAGLTPEQVASAVGRLTGDIEQVPSSVSAIKVDGVRSYAKVRGGDDVKLQPRPVRVSRFDVLDEREIPSDTGTLRDIDIEVEVSSGTYVRALARDLGEALGIGGHLTALRRTRVGRFGIEDCTALDELAARADRDDPLPVIGMGEAAAAQFPVRRISAEEAVDLRHGKRLTRRADPVELSAAITESGELVAMLDESGPVPVSRVVFPA
ncbi:tRNA pseudouridine synthase B [Flexivirga endophytica]|uniref:tRNA pseudouridine synthase B n=1 Tax=Flexivirga endophytica TaxID=1849103 RepID=A0A916WYH8_9MICO|nr:tRNA pseudouridine(55) synthase TruB [Flexivirga endophytica]GGB40420.1 tRNA pseudouridine synthase B [Flexivirga endophytica]GHB48256.1 tRNA pseudouridine synthase B [Flexivirga endophytica]